MKKRKKTLQVVSFKVDMAKYIKARKKRPLAPLVRQLIETVANS